ncbi:hypothetical protein ANN_14135, partial [Periplaneta americana]
IVDEFEDLEATAVDELIPLLNYAYVEDNYQRGKDRQRQMFPLAEDSPFRVKKRKYEDLDKRIYRIIERYPDYKIGDALAYLRAIGHNLAGNFET